MLRPPVRLPLSRPCSLLPWLAAAGLVAQQPAAPADPARAFFQKGEVVRIRITLDAAQRQRLREQPREYASAAVQIGVDTFAAVGVKLKGAAGSFREIDDRPGFTVHLTRFGGTARLHGLQRFHLNNGVQDDSRLSEWLGSEVFTAAGLPAPRVGHAHVWLDGQDLGLYVLRESFDRQFLQRTFGGTAGNLYDGGFCQDVDTPLEKDSGDGGDDHQDLMALCELCRGVATARSDGLAARVDIPRFVDFMALESMLDHWDGYTRNMNNYRLWLPATGGAVFLPHGMDQLLRDADASVLDHPPAIVASAVLQEPTFRKRYRDRLKALLPLLAPGKLVPRLHEVAERLQRELAGSDADGARALAEAARSLENRLRDRHRNLEAQVKAPEPKPLALAIGKPLRLDKWNPAAETERIELARRAAFGAMALFAGCVDRGTEVRHGRWRLHVLLGKGRYQLRAMVRTEGVVPPPNGDDGDQHGGACLRVNGEAGTRLVGDQSWQPLSRDFEVGEFQRNVELACDLRAVAGKVWFRLDSLQLVRLPD